MVASIFAPELWAVETPIWRAVVFIVIAPWFVLVVYYIVTKLVNSTYIRINSQTISVTHGPLPYPFIKNVKIDTSNIDRIKEETKKYQGRTRRKYYRVSAVTHEGLKVVLAGDINVEAQSYVIKREVERFLKRDDH